MILVTGATGHIGNVLVRELLSTGAKVRALVLPGEDCRPLEGLQVEKFEGDILNPASLQPALQDVEKVFHLAGIISILPGKNELVRRVNVQGTHNLLEAARQAGVQRVIYTSSIHAITRAPLGMVIDERMPFDPDNTSGEYDRSKAVASLAVLKAVQEGMDAVIVCPTGVIGPYDFRGSEMGQLIYESTRKKLQFSVEGAYDFVDVRDVARGLILAGERGRRGETYILSGERFTIPNLVDFVRELVGVQAPHIRIPANLAHFSSLFAPLYYRLARVKPLFTSYSIKTVLGNSVISHAKAQRELGYSARSLRESIADTVRWFIGRQSTGEV
ncbi:MAG: SDR family oxidoreductase [Omnitrophica WOR_2 bacterium]